jgi:hypothetical protein
MGLAHSSGIPNVNGNPAANMKVNGRTTCKMAPAIYTGLMEKTGTLAAGSATRDTARVVFTTARPATSATSGVSTSTRNPARAKSSRRPDLRSTKVHSYPTPTPDPGTSTSSNPAYSTQVNSAQANTTPTAVSTTPLRS